MVYLLKPPFKMVDLSMAMSVSHSQMVYNKIITQYLGYTRYPYGSICYI